MAKIELICDECGRSFLREYGEHNRNQKIGRKTFCSLNCSGKVQATNLGEYFGKGSPEHLIPDNRKDEYSAFRFFLRKARARNKKKGWHTDLALPFLKELWDKQDGICPLSGWRMILPETSLAWDKTPPMPQRASLDRIVPRKPYNKGNVRFVCYMANLCRHTFEDNDVRMFAEAVVKNYC